MGAATLPAKPKCQIVQGSGAKNGIFGSSIIDRQLIRNNFSTSTWLLMGASSQFALLLLPIRPSYALAPAVIILAYRFISTLLMSFGILHNPNMDGVMDGKFAAIYPNAPGVGAEKEPSSEEICTVLVSSRSNHPLGSFAPYYKDLADYFKDMVFDLDANAPDNGFLGASSFSNVSDRGTSSELMSIIYFRSHEHLQAWSHGPAHRAGWDWWNKNAKKMRHIAIAHEVYSIPAGKWENIYINYHPAGWGATTHAVIDENGEKQWASPLIDASRGRLRSSPGRLGTSKTGDDNEKYGEEPYVHV